MNHPSYGVHDLPIQIYLARPRGDLPHATRPQAVRPRGGYARQSASHVPYGQEPRGRVLGSHFPSGPQFPSRGDRYPPSGPGMFGVFLTLSIGKCHNTGILHSLQTPVLWHLLTPCLSIDAGRRPGEHMAHGFWLFAQHD
jgi:hypothetical protein